MAVYSIEGCRDSCYPDTTVLVNKLDIREQSLLSEAESIIATSCSALIEKEMSFEGVDFDYYRNIHRIIFGDLYEWAGSLRKINMSKKGTVFCECSELENLGRLKFERLKNADYLCGLPDDAFLNQLTDFYHEMNMLHPFREGNGRTLRLFITLLVRNTGRDIDFTRCDTDVLIIAAVKAAQGDISLLREVLEEIIL
ncbi:MAG: Fic family protein [Ruminococcus sp.]|nr:Fic family protein [Ruminococcus sp.]